VDFADLDQKLFGWVYRAVRDLVRPKTAVGPGMVPLEPLALRLAVLAEAVAERPLRIEATDSVGGVSGAVLRLPRAIDVFPEAEANALLYVERVVLDAIALRHGLHRPEGCDDVVARIASVALIPSLVRAVCAELPAFEEFHRGVAASLLARPQIPAKSARGRGAEALARAVLEGGASGDVAIDDALAAIRTASPRTALPLATSLARSIASREAHRDDVLTLVGPLAGALLPRPQATTLTSAPEADAGPLPTGSERRGRSPDAVRRIELPEDRENENPLEHSFEKVHTADEYQGGRKALDGEDQLEEHADALDELDVKEVIRTREVARSIYRMDGGDGFEAADLASDAGPGHAVFHYDEWDGTQYRPDHCRLVVEIPEPKRGRAAPRPTKDEARQRHEVRKVFEALEQARRLRPRMPTGGEVDLDAVVDRYGSVRAGHEGPTRLYLDRPRIEPDVATSILLDLSSSSDAWLEQRHVIDVARSAIAILADVLDELRAPFAIAGFHSHTRQDCRYLALKSFEEPWSSARPRLFAADPTGYTRIGPAMRHATALLERAPGRRKALLLITDGRPTDYDRYEGRYGVTDVKKACDEAAERGIAVFALAMAKTKQPHLAAMFGAGGYEVLVHPDQLADRLSRAEAFFRR